MTRIDFTEFFRASGCPTPRKGRWVTEAQALRALGTVERHGVTSVKPTRAYLCPCGWWHLSSRSSDLYLRNAELDSDPERR